MGVTSQALTAALAKTFGAVGVKGVLLAAVVHRGPAARAGIQAGDIVTAFDDACILVPEDLQRVVALARSGQVVVITIRRDGVDRTVAVTVDEAVGGLRPVAPSRTQARTMADFLRLAAGLRSGGDMTLRIQRGPTSFYASYRIP